MAQFRPTLGLMLIVVACSSEVDAQAISSPCTNTGPRCIDSCRNSDGSPLADGNYQWCEGCHWFVQCASGFLYLQPCETNQVWHDLFAACLAQSPTCTECIVYKPSSTGNPITTTPAPIHRVCSTTGPLCIESCVDGQSGNYQWCARCDYFLQCIGGQTTYTACQPTLVYDHSLLRCDYESKTCTCLPNTLPPSNSGPCTNTGPQCIDSCANSDGSALEDGNYQWCEGCHWFVQCAKGVPHFQPCGATRVWHDLFKDCLAQSTTCVECIEYKPSTN